MYKLTRIKRLFILEKCLSTEVLPIWVSNPSRHKSLIFKIIHLFQYHATNHLPYWNCLSSHIRVIDGKLLVYGFPVYSLSQYDQLMIHIDYTYKGNLKNIQLWILNNFSFHIARFLTNLLITLQLIKLSY